MAKKSQQWKEKFTHLCDRVMFCSSGSNKGYEEKEDAKIRSVETRDSVYEVETMAMRGPKRPGVPRGGPAQTTYDKM